MTPAWFIDEELMREFVKRRGSESAHDAEMRAAIERFTKSSTDKKIGYVSVEVDQSLKRGTWMLRSPSENYMPVLFDLGKVQGALDGRSLRSEKIDLKSLSGELFLDAALTKLFIFN